MTIYGHEENHIFAFFAERVATVEVLCTLLC